VLHTQDPAAAVALAGSELDISRETAAAAFVGIVALKSGLVRYASAGFMHAVQCDGAVAARLEPTGPLIGADGSWETAETLVLPGQILACLSDGLVSARDGRGRTLGFARLQDWLCESYGSDTDLIAKRIVGDAARFSEHAADDDLTVSLLARSTA
jgi:serine phosphatase RsbU (regulator of sigma subunit)